MDGEKKIHLWEVKCKFCGKTFEHVFKARDIFRPHMFNSVSFTCPGCGKSGFDVVKWGKKMTFSEWQNEHPELNIDNLPDYSYIEDSPES